MAITGARPKDGLRLELERIEDPSPPWRYTGALTTPDGTRAARAQVQHDGAVAIELDPPDEGLAERVRLLVRAAWKHAQEDDGAPSPPPRRIARYRA